MARSAAWWASRPTRTPRPRPRGRGSRAGGRRRTCSARTRWSWPRPAPACRPAGPAAAGRGRWRRSRVAPLLHRVLAVDRVGVGVVVGARPGLEAVHRLGPVELRPKSTISLRWTSLKRITGSPRARAACRTSTAFGTASCWPTWSSALAVGGAGLDVDDDQGDASGGEVEGGHGSSTGSGASRAASTLRWKAVIGASWSQERPTSNHGDDSAAWMRRRRRCPRRRTSGPRPAARRRRRRLGPHPQLDAGGRAPPARRRR